MTTEKINFARLTKAQMNALNCMGIGSRPNSTRKTLESLVDMELIERHQRVLPGRFPATVTDYVMPIWVHVQWCEWCSKGIAE